MKYTDYKGNEVGYGYDELGNLIALTYPRGEIIRYTYYRNGLLHTVEDPEGRITSYEYDANGNLTRTVRPNGTEELCACNEAGRLVEQRDVKTVADGEEPEEITHYVYSYDGYGNVTSIEGTQTLKGADGNMTYGPVNGIMGELAYDCQNRLVSVGRSDVLLRSGKRADQRRDGRLPRVLCNGSPVLLQQPPSADKG